VIRDGHGQKRYQRLHNITQYYNIINMKFLTMILLIGFPATLCVPFEKLFWIRLCAGLARNFRQFVRKSQETHISEQKSPRGGNIGFKIPRWKGPCIKTPILRPREKFSCSVGGKMSDACRLGAGPAFKLNATSS